MSLNKSKVYIGDGVYLENVIGTNDFWLTTENGIEITNKIFLEREVAQILIDQINSIWNINFRLEEESNM